MRACPACWHANLCGRSTSMQQALGVRALLTMHCAGEAAGRALGLRGPLPGGQLPQLGRVGRVERPIPRRCQARSPPSPQPGSSQHCAWGCSAWGPDKRITVPLAGIGAQCSYLHASPHMLMGHSGKLVCRRFIKGDPGTKAAFATRLAGSADLYNVNNRQAQWVCHTSLPLLDVPCCMHVCQDSGMLECCS